MDNTASCMIEVCDLHKHYKDVHVLRGISTTVAKGEVCAVIGPSGSGKSTFLRCLNRLEEASSGEIFINAQEITDPHLNLNKMRENIGMVFQGFNLFPHMTAIQNIMLAPVNVRGLSHKEAEAYGMELLSRVGLADKHASYPDMLSGGQQQRVAIARALAMRPEVMLFDEPTSALDVSVQAKIINTLIKLQKEMSLSYLFITHDLSLMRNVADRVAIMYLGRIAEIAPTESFFSNPQHPYTKMLLSSIPVVSEEEENYKPKQVPSEGEIPSPVNLPTGCSFHTRCPFATEKCRAEDPVMIKYDEKHMVRCHMAKPKGEA